MDADPCRDCQEFLLLLKYLTPVKDLAYMTWSVHDSHPASVELVPWSNGTDDPSLVPPLGPGEVFHVLLTGCFHSHHVLHFLFKLNIN